MISNILKDLRLQANMSQAELAKLLGISRSAVSSYENATRSPNYEVLTKIARIFHVSTDYILGLKDRKPNPDKLKNVLSDISSLLESSDLDDKQKRQILLELKSYFKWRLENIDLENMDVDI